MGKLWANQCFFEIADCSFALYALFVYNILSLSADRPPISILDVEVCSTIFCWEGPLRNCIRRIFFQKVLKKYALLEEKVKMLWKHMSC